MGSALLQPRNLRCNPYYSPELTGRRMRSYLVAFGLVAIALGLVLFLAGYEKIGCTVGGSSSDPTFTNCNGATELEEAGGFSIVLAVILFAGALVPDSSSRYK
jgi:predicted anti-sigma-YlaC factor YlaD